MQRYNIWTDRNVAAMVVAEDGAYCLCEDHLKEMEAKDAHIEELENDMALFNLQMENDKDARIAELEEELASCEHMRECEKEIVKHML